MEMHLITGGNGFLGGFIARSLLDRGAKVRIIDVVDDPKRDPRSDFFKVDVLDKEKMLQAINGVDYVHHNAALVPLKKAGDRFWQVNVDGTRNVLEAAKSAGVKHLSHMSSSAIFGSINEHDCPITDKTPTHPAETYGRSKLAGERIIQKEMETPQGMSCSIIRPRTIVGSERLGIFQILYEWISEGRNIYIIGNGSNLFQFAHVDDLVDVSIESAIQQKRGFFNIGTDRYRTLREDLEDLCQIANTGSKIVGLPVSLASGSLWLLDKLKLSPLAPWHYLSYHKPFYFDISKPITELGWKPKFSNIEMLKISYKWYLDNKEQLHASTSGKSSTHRSPVKQRAIGLLKKIS